MPSLRAAVAVAFTVLASACDAAHAQAGALMMPEGSHDLYVGAVAIKVAGERGAASGRVIVLPAFSGQWSNGVFASLGTVGLDACDDPTLSCGPLATYWARHKRFDDTAHESSLVVQGGGFARAMFTRDIGFEARVLYGAAAGGGGLRATLGADLSQALGSHDSISASPGLTWSDGVYLRTTYGVTAAQAARDRLPAYRIAAGVEDVHVDLDWSSELGPRWGLSTGLSLSRLVGAAARSPVVDRRVDASLYTSLSYRL